MRHPTRLSYGSQLRLTVDDVNPRIDHDLPPPSVLCMGEILWDSLPSGIYMGGAPSNVAVHLASLLRQSSSTSTPSPSSIINNHQPTVAIAACLGNDQLGREAYRRLSLKGVRTDCIQFHEVWETGMATATLNESGDATYEFNTPAAWDGLRWDDRLKSMMQQNDNEESSSSSSSSTKVVIMGTIAARLNGEHGSTSSSTLATIRNIAREGISLVLDVNLRSPWYTPESVLGLARGVDASASAQAQESPPKLALLKLNEEELCILEEWCGLPTYNGNEGLAGSVLRQRMEQLGSCLNAQRICVTRGKDGAALLCTSNSSSGDDDDNVDGRSIFHENPGYSNISLANNDCDSVGAGDAFLAALVSSLFLYNESPERVLERACALGGYVAGCRGATPEHGDAPKELRQIFSFHG
ncbi:hypothetical protein ACHAWU_003191 [Discostella pseudostelligera]|uniref:Carbohydrate kinase PfkB domain-containing protein n=1 Tax=Discostella pseudostelligera TaxID=259834 RepID=A0ABD3M4F8_9STRA